MAGPTSLMDAAKTVPPLQQGAFENLCGLYSAINAIRLCLWANKGVRLHNPRQLFDWGVDQLEKKWGVASVLHEGMDIDQWQWLTDRIAKKASRMSGSKIRRRKFVVSNLSDLAEFFEKPSCRDGRLTPVMLHISGSINHYTVLLGVSARRVWLYDSHGRHWINRGCCGLGKHSARYIFDLKSMSYIVLSD
jgi:hypothetical protein